MAAVASFTICKVYNFFSRKMYSVNDAVKFDTEKGSLVHKGTVNKVSANSNQSQLKSPSSGDFPGGTVVGSPPANAGDMGSIPGTGRSHMPWSN